MPLRFPFRLALALQAVGEAIVELAHEGLELALALAKGGVSSVRAISSKVWPATQVALDVAGGDGIELAKATVLAKGLGGPLSL